MPPAGSRVGCSGRTAVGPKRPGASQSGSPLADLTTAERWAYGDSAGDDEMLAAADHPVRVDGTLIGPEPG